MAKLGKCLLLSSDTAKDNSQYDHQGSEITLYGFGYPQYYGSAENGQHRIACTDEGSLTDDSQSCLRLA